MLIVNDVARLIYAEECGLRTYINSRNLGESELVIIKKFIVSISGPCP
jgi:hypothetical protein